MAEIFTSFSGYTLFKKYVNSPKLVNHNVTGYPICETSHLTVVGKWTVDSSHRRVLKGK